VARKDQDPPEDEEQQPRRGQRPGNEGVRIIGAEEAAAALETGQAAGRRPEDEPRFGDRPEPPQGPRPPLRFPLADADPASVPKPPPVTPGGRAPEDTQPTPLPHWTEPPSGEVPRILAADEGEADDDDMEAWSSFSGGPRWRDQPTDWEEPDFQVDELADEERLGALDTERPAKADLYSFDEPEAGAEPEAEEIPVPTRRERRVATRARRRPAPAYDQEGGDGGSRNVPVAIGVGVLVGALVLIAAAAGPAAFAVLAAAAVVLAAAELYSALRTAGYQPATLLGLVATASLVGAAYWRGEQAFPLVLALFVVFGLLWYLAGVVRSRPAANLGATLLAFGYVGFLGSFAALLLKFHGPGGERNGVAFLLGAIIATVAFDVAAFFGGRRLGRTPLAPTISPHKTWEGVLVGAGVTGLVCLLIVRSIHPWTFSRAFWLAVIAVVAGTLGDLSESMIKRDLGIKDMSAVLPGHGGLLDRMDALLFVIPATYYLVRIMDFGLVR